jgi:hypothetical protein
MGNYDDIGIAIGGQKASASQFGIKVRDAIIDLDRRVSAYDASTGVGKVFAATSVSLGTASEVLGLTLTGQVFKAGYAYEAIMRAGVATASDGNVVNFRVRKWNATPASGADWGEYYRFRGFTAAGTTMSAYGSIYLLNATASDITSDVNLTYQALLTSPAASVTGLTATPRFFTIRPAGFAADYTGMGVQVS